MADRSPLRASVFRDSAISLGSNEHAHSLGTYHCPHVLTKKYASELVAVTGISLRSEHPASDDPAMRTLDSQFILVQNFQRYNEKCLFRKMQVDGDQHPTLSRFYIDDLLQMYGGGAFDWLRRGAQRYSRIVFEPIRGAR